MNGMSWLLLLPVIVALALFVGYFAQKLATARKLGDAESRAQRILDDAKRLVDQASREAESKIREAEAKVRAGELEAKELVLKVRTELDQEGRARQKEIQEVERRIIQQEEQLTRRLDQLDRRETDAQARERGLGERERAVAASEARLSTALEEQRRKLEGIAGLTAEEAKRQLLAQMEAEARREAQLVAMRLEEEARETAHVKAKEVLAKVKQEMEQHIKEEGEKACFEVGVHGLHPELVKLVGRMKYRTSYGQNCLQHSKEVAWLAGMMAAEIGVDAKLAKRMGLLHEIGKALTHEQEGSHPELSLQVLSKYGESPQIINAALCGHENVEAETIEAVLTEAADGISAARPGARRDVLESYIKRLAKLEEIAMSYKGVEMCYAIQAGRELRIMTKAEQITDLDAHQLAKDISKRIEAEMQYPG